jgi:succinoglycan biosynthesis transport protein ExoP
MQLSELIRILWARRATTFWILTAVLIAALAASLLLPKKYRSEAAIVVDIRGSDPLSQDASVPTQAAANYLATQVDVISSHNVALKVVDRMKLVEDKAIVEQFQESAHENSGPNAFRDWAADYLLKSLSVRPSKDSNVIHIQFTSRSPSRAADITNAFADGYMQTSLELNVDPARNQAGWFDQQVNDLRSALQAAQGKLASYQGEHGVIGADDNRLDAENARLTEIGNRLVAAQTAMYDAETRQRQMRDALAKGRADESVNLLNNPLLQNLKAEVARSEAKFADVAQRFDRNHPQYLSARAELDSLRAKVSTEIENANATVSREAQVAHQNTADLQRAMDQQRARILALQHNQDELSVLKRDVESARTAYDSALQHGSQTKLQSRLDHTNIALLNRAFPPIDPSWPRLPLNLALAVVLGLLFGIAASITAESLNRRIHSRDDLLGADITVLGELPRASSTRRLRRVQRQPLTRTAPRIEPA